MCLWEFEISFLIKRVQCIEGVDRRRFEVLATCGRLLYTKIIGGDYAVSGGFWGRFVGWLVELIPAVDYALA